MGEYRGSCGPGPDQSESGISWRDQTCLICGSADVVWTYRLDPGEPHLDFALDVVGEWPVAEEVVRVLRGSLVGGPVRR
ncbi:hypothetical protein [Streptomyces niveiscabiei]|uniref:Uncharacterized protein n=1 Tax=Streptomyces niveiscabiei TaxID=164115 RepID=A0ABW9HXD2_9ACTN